LTTSGQGPAVVGLGPRASGLGPDPERGRPRDSARGL